MNWDQKPPDLLAGVLGPAKPIGPYKLPRPTFMRVDDAMGKAATGAKTGAMRLIERYGTPPAGPPTRPAPPPAPAYASDPDRDQWTGQAPMKPGGYY